MSTQSKQVLRELQSVSGALRVARSKKDVLDFIIKTFLRLDFDRVRVWLIDEKKMEKRGGKASYIPDKKFQSAVASLNPHDPRKLPLDYIKIIKKRQPFINKTFSILRDFFGEKKLKYSVEFPLFAGNQPLGLISVDNAPSGRPIDLARAENALMPLANHIALVLYRVTADEKIRAANRNLKTKIAEATTELRAEKEKLKKLAHYDDLSGLPNRRFLQEYLREILDKQKKKLIYAMLDIDFLKHVNDTRGHAAGDQLIAQFGKILGRDSEVEFAARFAGDEFSFLVKNRGAQNRTRIFRRILRKIEKSTGSTASIGCVTIPHPEIKSTTDLMRLADDALYHAKHTGRNRFVCFDKESDTIHSFAKRKLDLQKIEEQEGTFAFDYIRQLAAINKIAEDLRTAPSEKIALGKIATSLKKTLDFRRVGIFLKDANGKFLLAAHTSEKNTQLIDHIRYPEKVPGLIKRLRLAERTRKVCSCGINSDTPKFVRDFAIEKSLFIPLVGRRHVIGAIVAQYDPRRTFRTNDLDFFLTLGDQIENGIVKARAVSEIESFNRKLKKEIGDATKKLSDYAHSLEEQITDNQILREKEERTHFELISALITSIEEKDIYTRGHSVRVARFAVKLGRASGINKNALTDLRYAGLLHDIGKVAIDQSILQKETALSENETHELEKHPVIGAKIISGVKFLESAAKTIRHHHEKWDGSGYPDGLRRKEIEPAARILAIADAYDAMTTRRSYGKKMPRAEAIHELELGAGKQFDPQLVKIFVQLLTKGKIRTPRRKLLKKMLR